MACENTLRLFKRKLGAFDMRRIMRLGFVPFGVDFKNPDFARVAEATGAKGIRLEEPGDVKEALTEALVYEDGPVVVDAVVDPYALSLPPHVPFHTAKDYTLRLAKQVLAGRSTT